MNVSESDRLFVQQYNFDAEDISTVTMAEDRLRRMRERRLLIDGYIEGHPGLRFSLTDVASETGLDTNLCKRVIETHPLVKRVRDWHKSDQYLSTAPPLQELIQTTSDVVVMGNEELGVQARADW